MIMHTQSSGIVGTAVYSSIPKDIYGYSDIDAYSPTHSHLTRGERGGLPCPFWKLKNVSWFWKGPHCVHLWVKFSIQNVALGVSWRKDPKCFPGASFSCVLMKCLSKCPISTNSTHPLPWKSRHYSFCKTLHLKCLTVFWIDLSQ